MVKVEVKGRGRQAGMVAGGPPGRAPQEGVFVFVSQHDLWVCPSAWACFVASSLRLPAPLSLLCVVCPAFPLPPSEAGTAPCFLDVHGQMEAEARRGQGYGFMQKAKARRGQRWGFMQTRRQSHRGNSCEGRCTVCCTPRAPVHANARGRCGHG